MTNTNIPEEKLKEWEEEFESTFSYANYEKDVLGYVAMSVLDRWTGFLYAKTSSYEREMKLVEALRALRNDYSFGNGQVYDDIAKTLKELGYE